MRLLRPLTLAALLVLPLPTRAVQPDEVLADPVMETRARSISRQIRCPVCQGENIDDSNAPISRDLRIILRERLMAGDSDTEVREFLVARYGEFVLFDPPKTGANLVLWLAGPLMLILAGGVAVTTLRRRNAPQPEALSETEAARLAELMKD